MSNENDTFHHLKKRLKEFKGRYSQLSKSNLSE